MADVWAVHPSQLHMCHSSVTAHTSDIPTHPYITGTFHAILGRILLQCELSTLDLLPSLTWLDPPRALDNMNRAMCNHSRNARKLPQFGAKGCILAVVGVTATYNYQQIIQPSCQASPASIWDKLPRTKIWSLLPMNQIYIAHLFNPFSAMGNVWHPRIVGYNFVSTTSAKSFWYHRKFPSVRG
jgi:hypothetical protein